MTGDPDHRKHRRHSRRSGLTLVELIVAFTILLILSTMALPLARVKVQREKERRLRQALTEIRTAIDRYKDMADRGELGQIDPDTFGYPATLEAMVEGVVVTSAGAAGGIFAQGQITNQSAGASGRAGGGIGGIGGFGQQGGSSGLEGRSGGASSSDSDEEQTIRFLRRIPEDPITNSSEWGLRSVQDDPDSMSWGGQNVFDVYSRSMDTSLDGTRYNEW